MTWSWTNALFDANTPMDENITLTYWQMSRNFFIRKFFDGSAYDRVMQIFIPSPAQREDPKGWVLPEVMRLSETGEPIRQAAE